MKKNRIIPLALAVVIGLAGCGKAETPAPELKTPVSVEFDTTFVTRGNICNYRYYDGEILPVTTEIKSESGGLIKEVLVKVGDYVKKGDVVARYTDDEARALLESLEADIEYNRKKYSYENEIASISAEESGSELDALRLRQQKETQDLEMRILNEKRKEVLSAIGECDIIAPESGYVVYAAQSGYVNKDGYIVITADPDRLVARTDYINDQIIGRADEITVFFDGEEIGAAPQPYERNDYVAAMLRGGKFYTYYDLSSVPSGMEEGDYAQLIIKYNMKDDVLMIPTTTLSRDADGYYVYKREGDTRVKVSVAIGVKNELEAEVLDGLSEGDEVYVKN